MDEYRELNKYNRPQLMKIVLELQEKNRILNEAITEALQTIEDLKKDMNKDAEEYEWELHQQKESEHIS